MAAGFGYNLKDPEEVKLYLENLFTEYQFGCYGEKNPEVCHLLGDYYEVIKKEPRKAIDIYKNNCDNLEYPRSCTKYGGYRAHGKGSEVDNDTAFRYLKKGCELNDPLGCANAGLLVLSQMDFDSKEDIKKTTDRLSIACDGKQEKACTFLSALYIMGLNRTKDGGRKEVINRDLKEALKFTVKSCELGNSQLCRNAAAMYARGDGCEKSMENSRKFTKLAQEIENRLEYADQVEFGMGTK